MLGCGRRFGCEMHWLAHQSAPCCTKKRGEPAKKKRRSRKKVTTARIAFRDDAILSWRVETGRVARASVEDGRLLGRAGGLGALRAGRGSAEGRDHVSGQGAYAATAERRNLVGCWGRCGTWSRPRRSRRRRTARRRRRGVVLIRRHRLLLYRLFPPP